MSYVNTNRDWFPIETTAASGDSGSPISKKDATGTVSTGGLVSTGINLSGSSGYEAVGGNALEYITNQMGLRFN